MNNIYNTLFEVTWRYDPFDELHRQFFDDREDAYEFIRELRDIDQCYFVDFSVM